MIIEIVMIYLHVKPMGELWCGVALEANRVCATTFTFDEPDAFRRLLIELPYDSTFQVAEDEDTLAEEVLQAIKAMWKGKDVSFTFHLAMTHLSGYAQKVLRMTSLIPTGYVTTYGALAKVAGGSPRSVGRVMATNPFPPLVPCHRVVAADLTLGGYGGGLAAKMQILHSEDRGFNRVLDLELSGGKLKLVPVSKLKSSKR
jgi:methylated-DNA-[protein]-cysteine S-methyltransferase